MTTIAANRECMAADSLCDHNGLKTLCEKVFRINGDLVATAGDSQVGYAFLEWYEDPETEIPELDAESDFEALVLEKGGRLLVYGYLFKAEPVVGDYYALGSGSHYAMAYMENGATPAQAVYAACMKTTGSGPPVQILRL